MSENKNSKNSQLVQSVVALDEVFSNLKQLSTRIDGLNLKNQSDFDLAESLFGRFTEVGESVSLKIGGVATSLNDARAQAEAATAVVAQKAEQFRERKNEVAEKLNQFRLLGEKVTAVTSSLDGLDRENMANRLSDIELQLRPLIDEAQQLKEIAQQMKIKILEQGADSMRQSLLAVSQKMISASGEARAIH